MPDDLTTSPATEAAGPLGYTPESKEPPPKQDDSGSEEDLARRAQVKHWLDKVKKARDKWDKDFTRMRDNMDFVAGLQWSGQKSISYDKYVVNMTLRAVNQGVASLYARNPEVVAKRRKKLDFQLWDGNMETIQQALMGAMQTAATGGMVPPEVMAILNDFKAGRDKQKLIERVGKTLELVYQYQMDSQTPRFKLQMKQLVRRVRVCGVAYIKVLFCRDYETDLTHSETRLALSDRTKAAQAILTKLAEGKISEDSREVEQLRTLVASLGVSPLDAEATQVKEHLTFDFPQATSIIPDPDCRMLKGFVGAKWIAEEFYYPLDFVNAFFEVNIKPEGEVKLFGSDRKSESKAYVAGEVEDNKNKKVRLWQISNLETKSQCILCDGYKDYVLPPEPCDPCTKGFWNIFPVTFNDIEVEEGCEATIFPPSDVDLLRPAQKEWNRTRQALRRHRTANSPRYMFPNGILDEEDLDRIESAEDQSFFPIKGLTPGQEPNKVIQPVPVVPIQPDLYQTDQLREDSLLATGQQEANIGPAQPNVTATVGTIAEQSRMSVAASDVDGLDDSLTEAAACGSEMILQEFSLETVRHIAGIGAVWPQENKQDFLNELELEVKAASSGRPNKAIEINNWEKIAPLLLQFGANPQAAIRKTIEVYDSSIEPADFYPLPVPQASPDQQPGGAQKSPPAPNQPSPGSPGQQQMMPAQ